MGIDDIKPPAAGERPSASRDAAVLAEVKRLGHERAIDADVRELRARPVHIGKITGPNTDAGDGWYDFTELRWDDEEEDLIAEPNGFESARVGPAYAIDGQTGIPAGTRVFIHRLVDSSGQAYCAFNIPRGGFYAAPVAGVSDGTQWAEMRCTSTPGLWEVLPGGRTHTNTGRVLEERHGASVFPCTSFDCSTRFFEQFEDTLGNIHYVCDFGDMFPVTLEQDGGSDGDSSTAASWTYKVSYLDGTVAGDSIEPWNQRELGPVTPATKGFAYWYGETLYLGLTNERDGGELCAT